MVDISKYILSKTNEYIIQQKNEVFEIGIDYSTDIVDGVVNQNPSVNIISACITYQMKQNTNYTIFVSIDDVFFGYAQHFSTNQLQNGDFESKYYIYIPANKTINAFM